jgi:hypothetical protein
MTRCHTRMLLNFNAGLSTRCHDPGREDQRQRQRRHPVAHLAVLDAAEGDRHSFDRPSVDVQPIGMTVLGAELPKR